MFWKKKTKKSKPSREEIIKNATKAMQKKREEIGDETLEKIRDAIAKRENSALEKAKRKIMAADQDKVRDHLSYMMREDD